ncbi:MAG: response regulator [Erythrobacter sp.]
MARRILLAEDDFISGLDLRATCEEAGFEVEGPHREITAALLACQKARPDLAILGGSGALALAKTLSGEDVPIIFHTARLEAASDNAGTPCRQFPRAASLQRPCPPSRFLAVIRQMLAPA